jgi:hypothetical protein
MVASTDVENMVITLEIIWVSYQYTNIYVHNSSIQSWLPISYSLF